MLFDPTGNTVLARVSTDADGGYALKTPIASITTGTYQVRFYESGTSEPACSGRRLGGNLYQHRVLHARHDAPDEH